MSSPADAQLLFGLLALQNGLIDQSKLVAAFQAWALDRSKSLADHLVDLGHLDEGRRSAIEALARVHTEAYGGIEKSLASITVDRSTRELLASVADADLDATLSHAGETDPDGTGTYHVGTAASGGQRFRILRPHARGGLGAVYVALDSELNREVALKQILDSHADDPHSRGRFLVEAEITGGLEHPGIVPVYGLGSYGDGRPYYAMRFIRGDSLREAIARFHESKQTGPSRSLEFRQLLKRFTDVCNAIEYAHARGVLHRDIKPGNVIVGKHGETLVVDWGLAKALGRSSPDAAERTLMPSSSGGSSETLPGHALGTPAYMSPEQARGDLDALGPRSDVYSLGATLHCLLVGRSPFDGKDAGAILKAVELGDFRRPRAVDSSIDPALEAIALKAMALDPADRYASARALADDVDCWLADERVEAYPEPWTRSLSRWLARHRTGVVGAAAAGLVALIGLGIISAVQAKARADLDAKNGELTQANTDLGIQRARAEERETLAIDAVKRFKDAVAGNPELRKNPALEPLRKALLQEPLAFFGGLRERLEADRDTRPESLARLAEVAFDHAFLVNLIGSKPDALRAFLHARATLEPLARDHPGDAKFEAALTVIDNNLGGLLNSIGRPEEALEAYERARDARERLAREHPDADEYRIDLAAIQNNLGELFHGLGRTGAAGSAYRRAVDLLEPLARDHPEVAEVAAKLATSRVNLGTLLMETGRLDEALASYRRALELLEPLANAHPGDAPFLAPLATCHGNIGVLMREAGRPDEALAAYRRALEIHERLANDHPDVTQFRADWAACLNNCGSLHRSAGRPGEALAAYRRALEIRERLAGDHPEVARFQADLATSRVNIALPLFEAGRPEEARSAYEGAIAIHERLAGGQPGNADFQSRLAAALSGLGHLLFNSGRPDEARLANERALAIRERLAREHEDMPGYASDAGATLSNLAAIDLRAARFAEAGTRAREAAAWQKKALAAKPREPQFRRYFENHLQILIRAERGLGHDAEANEVERELAEFRLHDPRFEALDARLNAVLEGVEPRDNAERLGLAQRAYDTKRFAAAARLWGEALDSDPKLAEDRRAQHAYNAACAAALAADGQGSDPPADGGAKGKLRQRALDWLSAERDAWEKLADAGTAQAWGVVSMTLAHWRQDPDLAAIRDPDSLAKLPGEERTAWRSFWDSVEALGARAAAP